MILPSLKRLQRGDSQEQQMTTLNNFMQTVYAALNKRLSLQDNFETQEFVAEVNGDTPSLEFPSTLSRPARLVLPVQVLLGLPTGPVTVTWAQVGNIIRITDITGLGAGVQYHIKLLAL